MTRILYVGNKLIKTDNVANSGYIWQGEGDVQDVPEPAARKLLAHPSVWSLAPTDAPGSDEGASVSGSDEDAAATLDELRAEAVSLGIKVPGTWREQRLLKEIADAKAAKATDATGSDESPQA